MDYFDKTLLLIISIMAFMDAVIASYFRLIRFREMRFLGSSLDFKLLVF